MGNYKRAVIGLWHSKSESTDRSNMQPWLSIGTSAEDRTIDLFQFGTGNIGILLVAAIHGNEVGTIKVAHRFISWAKKQPNLLSRFSFYIIPCLNPDGFARAQTQPDYIHGGLIGRFNGHGVDLNRNFPVPSFQSQSTWGRGKRYAESISVNCGSFGGSEPEIQSLIEYIKTVKPHVYIALHNAAGDVMGNNTELSQQLTHIFSRASGYHRETLQDWELLNQTGTAKEWTELQSIAYLEIEGRYRWGSDWVNHQKGFQAVLDYLMSARYT